MARTHATIRFWLRALALASVVAALTTPGVAAHADLDRAEPAADTVVATSPATVKLWFTQEVRTQGTTAEIVDAQGKRVDQGDAKVDLFDPDRKLMTVSLLPNLPHGAYTVRWTSVSAEDGDTERGEFAFYVGVRPVAPAPAAADARPAPKLHLESPRDGVIIEGDHAEIVTRLDSGKLADLGHYHVYVDGKYVMQVNDERFTVHGLSNGDHTIKIELAGKDHHAWQPAVEATVRVHVAGSAAAGPAPTASVPGHQDAAAPAATSDQPAAAAPATSNQHTHATATTASGHLPRSGGLSLGAVLPVGLTLVAAGLALRWAAHGS